MIIYCQFEKALTKTDVKLFLAITERLVRTRLKDQPFASLSLFTCEPIGEMPIKPFLTFWQSNTIRNPVRKMGMKAVLFKAVNSGGTELLFAPCALHGEFFCVNTATATITVDNKK